MRAYIPPNLDDNGGTFGGFFKKRNSIEAGVYLALLVVLLKALSYFIDFIFILIIFIVLALPGCIILLMGIDGQPVSRILKYRILYQKKKGVFVLRMPFKK